MRQAEPVGVMRLCAPGDQEEDAAARHVGPLAAAGGHGPQHDGGGWRSGGSGRGRWRDAASQRKWFMVRAGSQASWPHNREMTNITS